MLRGDSLLRMVIEGKIGGKENKRRTKTNDARLNDGRMVKEKLREEAQTTRGLMTSYIQTENHE